LVGGPDRTVLTGRDRSTMRTLSVGGRWDARAMVTLYYTATTLDGFLADENNSLEWLFEVEGDADHSKQFSEFFADIGAMAMGATTYEWVLAHEKVLDDPGKWRAFYGDVPLWVFTHRELTPVPDAPVYLTQDNVGTVHAAMTEAAGGKNIWLVGGGDLVGQFADRGLLDEIQVNIAPVTLGAGAPLLPRRLLPRDLSLESVQRNGQFVELTYRLHRGGTETAPGG
jgi:dihydrofolate reductase